MSIDITDTAFRIYRIDYASGLYVELSEEIPTLREAAIARSALNMLARCYAGDLGNSSGWQVERRVGASCGWNGWESIHFTKLPPVTFEEIEEAARQPVKLTLTAG